VRPRAAIPLLPALPKTRTGWLALVAFAAIVTAAIVLRFIDLAANPGGLFPDEAAEGLDAAKLLHQPGFHADFGVWFPDDAGREALFGYVVAGVFAIFGQSVLVLRAAAAGCGVAGVIAIGWLGRRFGTWTGIVAAAWAAGSLWLVCVSRDGMRNTIVPFFGALALVALLHWATRPGRGTALLAGAVTSLAALYTYQPLKLLPVLVVLWLLWLRRSDRARYDELRPGFIPFAAAFLVVAAPMIAIAVTETGNYFGRAAAVSTFNPAVDSDSSLPVHILRTIGMFGFTGDPNARGDVGALPLVPLPLAAVSGIGLARLWRMRRDAGHSLILIALPVFLVAPLVATEGGAPHALRTLGLAAPLGVAIGLGVVELVAWFRGRWGRAGGGLAIALVAVTLTTVATLGGWAYLDRPVADRYDAFSYPNASLSNLAAEHPGSAVIVDGYTSMDVEFIAYDNPPAIIAPGTTISNPAAYKVIYALTRDDLTKAVGPDLGGRAIAVAWDPSGKPVVWAVVP
jgi:hypothetical protein